ncbi:CsbD family protein [Paractinoplanes hotanensis]|uniref:CsbD family protein n=1 Tax=Paractinoplanes hotanensis TaxID=2906497 RepID=A0ABT0XZ47_9ACTN|nr:CsbD family protein [Actinoplanes hotanensis]MCM4078900.1 CsbD family protein [Actinoplanes hotanensis]
MTLPLRGLVRFLCKTALYPVRTTATGLPWASRLRRRGRRRVDANPAVGGRRSEEAEGKADQTSSKLKQAGENVKDAFTS